MSTGVTPPREAHINIGSTKDLETISELYLTSMPDEVITTTEDKVRLCLSDHLKKMEKKRGWLTPMGLTISFTLTLMTSGFKDMVFSAATWRAFFIIGDLAAIAWLINSIVQAFQSVKMDDVIDELKRHSQSMIRFVKK